MLLFFYELLCDNEKVDVIGAKAVGLKTCLYDKDKKYKQHQADFYINNFMELIDN